MVPRGSSKDDVPPAAAAGKRLDAALPEQRSLSRVAEDVAEYRAGENAAGWIHSHVLVGDGSEEPADFQAITRRMDGMSDEIRVSIIRHGLNASVARSMGQTFNISVGDISRVLLVSESTLSRKSRDNALLDPSATERMLRIAAITALAASVFEDEDKAIAWMRRDNVALGGQAPLSLCDNDISAAQVRRVLRSIEYGGVV